MREKEKVLATSTFSFSHNVFNPIKDKNHNFKYFNFVVCKCSSLFTTQSRLLTALYKKSFKNIVGKGENAGNQHFFSFSHNVFYPFQNKFQVFSHIYFVVCRCFQFGLVYNFAVW